VSKRANKNDRRAGLYKTNKNGANRLKQTLFKDVYMIKKVRGTQDILSMTTTNWLMRRVHDHFSRAHFTHIQTPVLEFESLFKRAVGEHTDVVSKEMYTLSTNDKDVLCLRPEATAGVVRAFLENRIVERPWKVFTEGPIFRHERPQKGRWRQFSQTSFEVIGTNDLATHVQFLATLNDFFTRTLGLQDVVLHCNFLGTSEDRITHKKALVAFLDLHKSAICQTCVARAESNPLRIFDCKNPECQAIYDQAPLITDHLSHESQQRWNTVNEWCDMLSINRIHNPLLVRGLDYYNELVFEFTSPHLGAQSAFCGGGAYNLSHAFGLKDALPSIGAAFGTERLAMIIEAEKAMPAADASPLYAIIAGDESLTPLALLAFQALHRAGKAVVLCPTSFKKGLKKANALGAQYAVLIGEEERNNSTVTIKDLVSGEQKQIAQDELC
jgi:histidyl-tRNA synthetase